MPYVLGSRSLERLKGVHPDLVKVVARAITLTDIDFTVLQGLRTEAEQRENVAKGASQTLNSRHLTGHAVDLGALVDGKVSWDWDGYYLVADAMQAACVELAIPLVWGGCWDRPLATLGNPGDASADYVKRRKAAGKKAFLDGPHFELTRAVYP